MSAGLRRLTAARNKVVFTMAERTGNIWIRTHLSDGSNQTAHHQQRTGNIGIADLRNRRARPWEVNRIGGQNVFPNPSRKIVRT